MASAAVLGAPPARAVPPGGMSAAALNTLFNQYGDTSGKWIGGDSTTSVVLPDGRVVWLFSDTFLGTVNADHTIPRTTPMVNNSAVVQDGTTLVATRYGGTSSAPEALVKPAGSTDMYWAGDATVEGSSLRVLYLRMRRTGPAPLDVALVGTALATFALPGLTLSSVTTLPLGDDIAWGSAILADGAYTYIYGTEFASEAVRFAHVARVPTGGLSGAWQFWTGTGWSTSETASTRLLSGVGTGFAVERMGSQYVLVTMESNLVFNPSTVAYTAAAPTGPFTGPIDLFTAPEPTAGSSVIVYDTRLHPELARSGKLLVSYNVNSLVPDDAYADAGLYRPRFVEVDWPRPVPDPATLPPAPTSLTATADGAGNVHLAWQAPTGPTFNIYQRDVTAGQTHFVRLPLPSAQTSVDLGFFKHGHTYEFRVTAVNGSGEGPPSNVVSLTVSVAPPPAPTGLVATASTDGKITLSWAPVSGAWRYQVYRRDVTAGQTELAPVTWPAVNGTTITMDSLEHGHEYELAVTAIQGGGESPRSLTVHATAFYAPPGAPAGLTATAQGDGTIRLSWTAPGPDVWYLVYQRDVTAGEAEFTQLPLPIVDGTTMTAGYLTHNHAYEYKVVATNRGGAGPASTVASAMSHYPLPGVPSGLTATAQPDGSIRLSWTAPAPDLWYLVYQRDVTAGETSFTQLPLPVTTCCTMTAGYLTHDHVYEYKVSATSAGGESAASTVASARSHYPLPAAPTNLRATAGDGQTVLTWDGSPDTWFLVYQRDVTAGETSFTQLPLPVTSCCTMTAGYLANGHTYEYRVTATSAGGESPVSNTVSVVPAAPLPGAPTGLTATAQADGTILLGWTAPASNVWYLVYQRDVTAGETGFTKLPLPITTCCTMTAGYLIHNHLYEYKVAATNATGEGPASSVASATSHYPLPAAPANLRGRSSGPGAIELNWDAPAPGLYYWVYYRDVTAGQATFTKSVYPTDKTTATWAWLADSHVYEFKVTAASQAGEGPASSTIQVTAHGGLPQPPSGLIATPGDGQATLTWTASPTGNVWYLVYQRDVTAGQSWQQLTLPITTCCTMTAGYLANGHTYEFKVTATNSSGESTPSDVASARPLPPLPAAPSGLTATPGDGQAVLRWTASPTANVWYAVFMRDVSAGQSWQELPLPVTTCCTFTARYLANGHTYQFKITATNLAGHSPASNVVSVRPLPPMPQAPTGLTATPGDGRVTLHWTASSTPNVWYLVEYRPAGGTWRQLPLPITTCCTFTAGYLVNGTTYEFRVRATNLAGNSAASNVDSARPMPPFPQRPSDLVATPGDGKVSLRWTASPTPGVWYWIYVRDVTLNTEYQRLPYPITTCCSLTVSYLWNGHTYSFVVSAFNAAGEAINPFYQYAKPMPPFPQTPTGLTGSTFLSSDLWHSSVRLNWNSAGNVYYWIYFRNISRGQTSWTKGIYPAATPTVTMTDSFYNNETYEFMVTSTNVAGESSGSNIVRVTPKRTKFQVIFDFTYPNMNGWNSFFAALGNQGAWTEYHLNWTNDGCSRPSWVPPSPFEGLWGSSCIRHDFGYRNHKEIGTFSSYKDMVDGTFLWDMERRCRESLAWGVEDVCVGQAYDYYLAVHWFG